MKTILFPTDFSRRADYGLKQVSVLAQKMKAAIIVYHVYNRPFTNTKKTAHMTGLLEKKERELDKKFKLFLEENPQFDNIDYSFRRELGLFTDKFIETAEREHIDLICMPTKGAKGLEELWGTKTAKIVKAVKVPMLVLPDEANLSEVGKVALICDYSSEANYHVLDFLSSLLQVLNLKADVLTLNRFEKNMSASEISYRQLVKKKLEDVPATFRFIDHLKTEHGLLEYCENNGIGLIAILNKKYGFFADLFHESLTEKMTFRSHIPLLVLK